MTIKPWVVLNNDENNDSDYSGASAPPEPPEAVAASSAEESPVTEGATAYSIPTATPVNPTDRSSEGRGHCGNGDRPKEGDSPDPVTLGPRGAAGIAGGVVGFFVGGPVVALLGGFGAGKL